MAASVHTHHQDAGGFGRVPGGVWILCGIVALSGVPGLNIEMTFAAAALLAGLFVMLWRPGEPPILLLVGGVQWLQVVTKIFHANALGLHVNDLDEFHGEIVHAIWLSMLAVLVLALGMRAGIAKMGTVASFRAREEAFGWSLRLLFRAYLASVVLALVLQLLAWYEPRFTQVMLALANLKWCVYFVLAYACFIKPHGMKYLAFAVALEIVLGLGAYFASFRMVFFVTLLALLASGRKLSTKQVVFGTVIASALVALTIAWTAIKVDYRQYLSEGQGTQTVTRGIVERLEQQWLEFSELTAADMSDAVEDMLERISYVDYFAQTLIQVPKGVPHTDGEILLGALEHIAMPRLFFPNKAPLTSDSEYVRTYTGLWVAGEEEGTSVGLGYAAQFYVDFGRYLMFVPVFLLGMMYGRIYRYLAASRKSSVLGGFALACPVLSSAMLFETSIAKILGAVIMAFIAALVVRRFLLDRLLRSLTERSRLETLAAMRRRA